MHWEGTERSLNDVSGEVSNVKMMKEILKTRPTRRHFLAGAGAVGATALIAGCNDSSNSAPSTGSGSTGGGVAPLDFADNDILNFALNLEYLEAEFYLRAATGTGLSAADAGTGAGTVTGGAMVTGLSSNPAIQSYVNAVAQDELNHVRAIRATIMGNSGTPVSRPNINFTTAFNTLASAAGIASTFDPFSSVNAFLVGAFVFEDVGVTAYNGAAPLLSSNAILSAAAGIAAVEAYHAAEIRTLLVALAAAANDQTYVGYANKVSTLRGTLGGGNETPLSATSIVAASTANAIGFSRTTDQVLHIVYGTGGGAGVKSGVFFPNGLNGTISTTAS